MDMMHIDAVYNTCLSTATDTSQLDYITLLGEKDLMMDHLLPLTAGGSTSASATLDPNVPASSLAPSSHAGDTHATLLSSIELINGDIGTGLSLENMVA